MLDLISYYTSMRLSQALLLKEVLWEHITHCQMTLNVIIEGFRCHGSYSMSCTDGLTLLRGTSGIGKSSIMEAIYWCLYGTLRNIYNPLHPNRRCKVTVECDNIIVSRSTKPTSLSVIYQDKTYGIEGGQDIIQYVFGSKDIFLSSSYISQGSKHNWIELTTDEKLTCIESIAYSDVNPDIYYNKAQEYKNKCSNDYDKMEIDYKIEERLFNDKGGVNLDLCCSDQELATILDNIRSLQAKKKQMEMIIKKRHECKTRLDQCNILLGDMERQLDSFNVEYTMDELSRMEINIQEHTSTIQHNRYAIEHNKKIDELYKIYKLHDPEGIIENMSVVPNIQDVIKLEIETKRYMEWLNAIKIYDDIKDLNILEMENNLQILLIHRNNESLRKQIASYGDIGDTSQYRLMELKDKINRYKTGKRFKCPECTSELELNGHELIKAEHICITDLEKEYKEMTILYDKQQKVNALMSRIQDIELPKDMNYTIDELTNIIARYKKYRSLGTMKKPNVIHNGLTSTLLTHWNNYKSSGNRMHIKEVEELSYDKKEIDRHKNLHAKRNHILESIVKIKKDIEHYNLEMKQYLDCNIVEVDKDIVSLNDKYSKAIHNNSQKVQYDKLVSIYNRLNELYTSKYYIEYIISCISHTEYTMINDTVDLFNRTLEDVVGNLFDEPMTLRIELLKTNKQNKSKAQIHLQITYKGMDITNVNQLSGGEGTRISIALLIAFHVIHPTPFILIDESLSNINHQLREQCCNVIKKYCHVPCLMILHETSSEGLFDNIIELS